MTVAQDGSLQNLMMNAWRRFTTLQICVTQRINLARYKEVLERRSSDRSAQAVLASPMFTDAVRACRWQIWLARPYCRVIQEFRPPHELSQIQGGNERAYWQVWPARQKYNISSSPPGTGFDDTEFPLFHTWLPAPVVELLDPSFIWKANHEGEIPPELTVTGSGSRAGRKVVQAEFGLVDQDARPAAWSQALFAAERYRLQVDETTGILLRAESLEGSDLVTSITMDSIFLDGNVDPSFFAVDQWIDASWPTAELPMLYGDA